MNNTIFALSTAFVKSAIAIIRVSGPNSFLSLKKITKKEISNFPANKMVLSNIYNSNSEIIDIPLIVRFEEGKSYTGENMVEYHVHGSKSVIKDLLYELSNCKDHRLADQGEFTKQALENNKLTLTQVEGINDLINSQTTLQRKQAIRGLTGDIAKGYEKWYSDLQDILAFYEASIDFSEEDIPEKLFDDAIKKLKILENDIKKEYINSKKIVKIKNGINLAILGSPNVGKSSFINAISNQDISIVSDLEGTTRDVVEIQLEISGYPVNLADTAGIRSNTKDTIEKEGIKRAISKAKETDIKIIILDITKLEESYESIKFFLNEEDNDNTIVVVNKVDLSQPNNNVSDFLKEKNIKEYFLVSIKNNIGFDELKNKIIKTLEEITSIFEDPIVVHQRHNEIIFNCLEEINLSLKYSEDVVIASFHLRNALNEIGRILGKVDIEDILGVIFSNFCIGK